MSTGFAGAEDRWRARLGGLRDVVRQELVTRQLQAHLPAGPRRVLDVGCGQGTQAMRLARLGHYVTGVDPSAELLGQFEDALATRSPRVRERVRLLHGAAEELAGLFGPGSFDVVLCQGVLMYLAEPLPALAAISEVVTSGGIVSLLVRNGDALAMRPGLLGDWETALRAFDSATYENRIGVVARADPLGELTDALRRHGLPLVEWYGVRVFTDTAPDDAAPPAGDQLDALLACEERAGRTDPYRRVAPLLHVITHRV